MGGEECHVASVAAGGGCVRARCWCYLSARMGGWSVLETRGFHQGWVDEGGGGGAGVGGDNNRDSDVARCEGGRRLL